MEFTASVISLTILIEAITLFLRMVFHYKSAEAQKKIHWPRVHHSYIGAILLISAFAINRGISFDNEFVVIGFALMFSDVLHHMIFLPLLSKFDYDIGMVNHQLAHIYVRNSTIILSLVSGFVYSYLFLG